MSKGFRIKSRNKLIQYLKKVNITDPKQPIVLYCQSGRRAAQTYFVLRWLGFRKVRLYDGSILEYAKQPGAAFRKGMRP
jgi:thiosulfate/3-mercaptopyruvate sulfurtransferase